ncbi:sulfotransferase family 2 domain-containing protein [uncultured Gilvimarinus sp.]|mgnify:CR=1 FL=1|uniref:sulfotransferase family 2 domain-containing protein n=1 Tax=uncultured Gilvimarinus sp. TaxID=1689143 RepID=UPI0030DAF2EF
MAKKLVNHFELFALLPEHQLVICITPKAASMSIIQALASHYGTAVKRPSHKYSVFRWYTLEQVQAVVPNWRRAMFVRHPLERLCSVYDYHITKHNLERSKNLRDRFNAGMSFTQFAGKVIERPDWDSHFVPQSWMSDRADFVGKFENMATDWQRFKEWAGVDLPALPHVNSNPKSGGCSFNQLSGVQQKSLRSIYAGDIKNWYS